VVKMIGRWIGSDWQRVQVGRPAGGEGFIAQLEGSTGRDMRKGLPGRQKRV